MKVTIWDLDYYHAKVKENCLNPDVMKISSYHKQMGDRVNFVLTADDINRPYDLYYIIKEETKTPMPPVDFFMRSNIRWWGKAVKKRVNWAMPDEMLICRPDYLLYPEKNTKFERSEHIRLFNDSGKLLPVTQDWKNTFSNKFAVVTDTTIWQAKKEELLKALQILQDCKNISFFHPIWIQKILEDEEIKEEFLKIKFIRGCSMEWTTVEMVEIDAAWELMSEIKKRNSGVRLSGVTVDYMISKQNHWTDVAVARRDFQMIRELICRAKEEGFKVIIKMPTTRFETPYFFLFEELARWTKSHITTSWLEYITNRFGNARIYDDYMYWNNPSLWSEPFKNLLSQTWTDKRFLLDQWKGKSIAETNIAWKIWEKEFNYGI